MSTTNVPSPHSPLWFRLWFGIVDFHFFFLPLLVLFPYLSVRFGSITSSPAALRQRGSTPPSSPTSETLPCYWGTLFRGTTSMLPALWGQRKQSHETNFPIGMLKAVLWDSNASSPTLSHSGWHPQLRVVLAGPESMWLFLRHSILFAWFPWWSWQILLHICKHQKPPLSWIYSMKGVRHRQHSLMLGKLPQGCV